MKLFWKSYIPRIYKNILWLFFPHRCVFCNEVVKRKEITCQKCEKEVKFIKDNTCRLCGRDIENCFCGNEKCYYLRNVTCFYYHKAGAKGIINFKVSYPDDRKLDVFSDFMADKIKKSYIGVDFDIIAPVPLHKRKFRKRGYNQSFLLAKWISKKSDIKLIGDLLIKWKETPGQHKLNREERRKNLKDSFKVNEKYDIKGLRILLIDDVITTGSSLNECSRMLIKMGADSVYCATLAATGKKEE
ncbi:MAG: ComF family protein [Clostridia bacterium]|nr:ComF family protein [Clostridia bacterium]